MERLCRRFLGETYSILSEKRIFHKMKVYLIQCDCCIQDVKVIHSEEEWKEYSKNITIQGRGGDRFPAGVPVCEGSRRKRNPQS